MEDKTFHKKTELDDLKAKEAAIWETFRENPVFREDWLDSLAEAIEEYSRAIDAADEVIYQHKR
jgi:hypothetical protein